jgi:hypothetical protein
MPTGFFIWGYIQIFGDAMYPLTLHLGVQRKLTAFFPVRGYIASPKIWMYPQMKKPVGMLVIRILQQQQQQYIYIYLEEVLIMKQ